MSSFYNTDMKPIAPEGDVSTTGATGTWGGAAEALSTLGAFVGEKVRVFVPRSGMAYLDALKLYGAIDLYIGSRQRLTVKDTGIGYLVESVARPHVVSERPRRELLAIRDSESTRIRGGDKQMNGGKVDDYLDRLKEYLTLGTPDPEEVLERRNTRPRYEPTGDFDTALATGVRADAAKDYKSIKSGETTHKRVKASIPLSEAILARAGLQRVPLHAGEISFLPIFEGEVDFSLLSTRPPGTLAGGPGRERNLPRAALKAFALLTFAARFSAAAASGSLTAVAYNLDVRTGSESGLLGLKGTAVGALRESLEDRLMRSHLERCLCSLSRKCLEYGGKQGTRERLVALSAWILAPSPRSLATLLTSQEKLLQEKGAKGEGMLFVKESYRKEILRMSYEGAVGDGDTDLQAESIRKFASAVEAGIYYGHVAEEKGSENKRKEQFNQIARIRSCSNLRALRDRCLLLIERGRRRSQSIGSAYWEQDFDPDLVFEGIDTGADLKRFRDTLRSHLLRASAARLERGSANGSGEKGGGTDNGNNASREEDVENREGRVDPLGSTPA